jgi:hypothetical protein
MIEDANNLVGEAALGLIRGALHEEHDVVFGDGAADGFDRVGHNCS